MSGGESLDDLLPDPCVCGRRVGEITFGSYGDISIECDTLGLQAKPCLRVTAQSYEDALVAWDAGQTALKLKRGSA